MRNRILVVVREHWLDNQSSLEDSKPQPIACFSSCEKAEQFVLSKMSGYPEEMVHEGKDEIFFENEGIEFDSYKIFESTIDPN